MQLLIICSALVLEVFLYYLLIGILPHGVHVVATGPELASPEHLFHLRMKAENLFRDDALHRTDYLLRGVNRNTLDQEMHMVPVQTDFQKVDIVTLLYPKTDLFEGLRNRIAQNLSPIFDRTNKMVQKQAFVMVLVDVFAHIHKYININTRHPRQSLGEF